MTRFVFDTNVIVSAVLFNNSVPGQAFSRALSHGMILVSSIVTGDADLLVLNPFRGIEIVTPAEFLKLTI